MNKIKSPLESLINKDYLKKSLRNKDNLLFEQYKIYIEMSNDLCNRRDKNNKFYVTVSSVIVVLTSYFINNNYPPIILLLPVFTGIVLCYIWYKHMEDYKLLNEAKFDIINHLEDYLPVKGFTVEWDLIDRDKYKGLTYWDKNIPLLFLAVLTVIALIIIHLKYI